MLCRLLAALMWTLLVLTIFESAKAVPIDNSVEWPGIISNEKTGVSIAQWTENSNMNPEELGSYLEGDIMITKSTERNGLANQDARWPGGIIPITVTGNFSKYIFENESLIILYCSSALRNQMYFGICYGRKV